MSGAGSTWAKCEDCLTLARVELLDRIVDQDDRVRPGDVMPWGQCLECGGLALPLVQPGELRRCPQCGIKAQVTDTHTHSKTYTLYLTCESCRVEFWQVCEDVPRVISTQVDQLVPEVALNPIEALQSVVVLLRHAEQMEDASSVSDALKTAEAAVKAAEGE